MTTLETAIAGNFTTTGNSFNLSDGRLKTAVQLSDITCYGIDGDIVSMNTDDFKIRYTVADPIDSTIMYIATTKGTFRFHPIDRCI